MGLITKIFGTYSDRELKQIYPIVDKIEAMEPDRIFTKTFRRGAIHCHRFLPERRPQFLSDALFAKAFPAEPRSCRWGIVS